MKVVIQHNMSSKWLKNKKMKKKKKKNSNIYKIINHYRFQDPAKYKWQNMGTFSLCLAIHNIKFFFWLSSML